MPFPVLHAIGILIGVQSFPPIGERLGVEQVEEPGQYTSDRWSECVCEPVVRIDSVGVLGLPHVKCDERQPHRWVEDGPESHGNLDQASECERDGEWT